MTKLVPIAAALALVAACSKDSGGGGDKAEPAAGDRPAVAGSAAAAVDAVMGPYEVCRAALAADKATLAACGKQLAEAARAAAAVAPEPARPQLSAIAQSAAKLSDDDDVAAARIAFGEVSKPVVALVTEVDEAHDRYHVFECPMASGYNRWVQREAKMANPYMGTQMLECGTEIELD